MQRLSIVGYFIVALSLIAPSSTYSADFMTTTSTAYVEHRNEKKVGATIRMGQFGSNVEELLSLHPVIRLQANERLSVVIEDPHPFLFTYTGSAIEKTSTESATAIEKLSGILRKMLPNDAMNVDAHNFVAAFGDTKTKAPIAKLTINGIDLIRLRSAVQTLSNNMDTIPDLIRQSIESSLKVEGVKEEVESWSIAKTEKEIDGGIDGLLSAFLAYEQGDELEVWIDANKISVKKNDGSDDDQNGYETQIKTEINETITNAKKQKAHLATFETVNTIVSMRSELDKLLATAKSFTEAIKEINKPLVLKNLSFDPANDQSFKIKIEPNEKFSALIKGLTDVVKHQKKHSGTYEIVVNPRQVFKLKVSPGVVLSFVEQADYGTEEATDSTFNVTKTDKTQPSVTGAIAFNIEFGLLQREHIRPFFQFGLSPNTDRYAFLGGFGFYFGKDVVLAAGIIYQQRDILTDGLEVGDEIDSVDKFKTEKEFKSGFYISAGIDF